MGFFFSERFKSASVGPPPPEARTNPCPAEGDGSNYSSEMTDAAYRAIVGTTESNQVLPKLCSSSNSPRDGKSAIFAFERT